MAAFPEWSIKRERWLLAVLLLFAFALRLGAIIALSGLNTPPTPGSDAYEYDVYAWNVAQGHGYRGLSPDVRDQDHATAYRTPLASLYYAGVYRVFGHSYAAAHVVDSFLAAVTVLVLFSLTLYCFGRREAWLAALLYTFYPLALYFNVTLISETLAVLLVSMLAWCCLRVTGPRGAAWAATAGLLLGALLLCKPGFIFLLLLLPFWAWAVCRRDRHLWMRAVLIPLLAIAALVPWTVRNQLVMGAFVPFSTSGGSMLLQTSNRIIVEDPLYHGYAVWDSFLPEYREALKAPDDEVKRDAVARGLALEWLRANPDRWFYLLRGRFVRLWTPWLYGDQALVLKLAICGYYGFVLLFFAGAAWPMTLRFLRERHPGLIMQFLIGATVLMALAFQGQHRYRFPVDVLCTSIAAAGMVWLFDTLRQRSQRAAFAAVGQFAARNRVALGAASVALIALLTGSVVDERAVERYRQELCRQRIAAVAGAVAEYRTTEGRPPARLLDLVPRYLPDLTALHCPKHSLDWSGYYQLGCAEPEAAGGVVSYDLDAAAGASGDLWIVERRPLHDGARHRVAVRSAPASEAALPRTPHPLAD